MTRVLILGFHLKIYKIYNIYRMWNSIERIFYNYFYNKPINVTKDFIILLV